MGYLDGYERGYGPWPTATLPALEASGEGGVEVEGQGTLTLPALEVSGVGASPVEGTGTLTLPGLLVAGLGTVTDGEGNIPAPRGPQVRSVNPDGTLVSLIATGGDHGVSVGDVRRAHKADEAVELLLPGLSQGAKHLQLFDREVQIWFDGELYGWFRPARTVHSVAAGSDQIRVECLGLASYLDEQLMGLIPKPNHITAPHEVAADMGTPSEWQAVGTFDWGVVTNNAEFWATPKALQVNGQFAGSQDHIRTTYAVDDDLAGIEFAAAAYIFIADNPNQTVEDPAPAWAGPAFMNRGLMVRRLNASGVQQGKEVVAEVTDDTPRNQVVRLQVPTIVPLAGETLEVSYWLPGAWVAVRFVGLFDGRAVEIDRRDKSIGFRTLAAHGQDVALGKEDHLIGTDIEALGEVVSRRWPWHERQPVGHALRDLADTFEYEMAVTPTTRTLRQRRRIGVTRDTILKVDLAGWESASDAQLSGNGQVGQGQGSGPARDEWAAIDRDALGGHIVDRLFYASEGLTLGGVRDQATNELLKAKFIREKPAVTITGPAAIAARPGDEYPAAVTHGDSTFPVRVRASAVNCSLRKRAATLDLELV